MYTFIQNRRGLGAYPRRLTYWATPWWGYTLDRVLIHMYTVCYANPYVGGRSTMYCSSNSLYLLPCLPVWLEFYLTLKWVTLNKAVIKRWLGKCSGGSSSIPSVRNLGKGLNPLATYCKSPANRDARASSVSVPVLEKPLDCCIKPVPITCRSDVVTLRKKNNT